MKPSERCRQAILDRSKEIGLPMGYVPSAKLIAEHTACDDMAEALRLAWNEINAIRARSGAPLAIDWGPQGPIQWQLCTEEWWDELTEKCHDALVKAGAIE